VQALKFFAAVGLAVIAHLIGMQVHPGFALAVDVFVVVVALHALEGNSLSALFAGLFVGLVHDSLTGSLFGLYGFADTIVGYGTARLAQRLVIQRASGVLAVVAFASALQETIVVGLTFLLLSDPPPPDPVLIGLRAGVSGMLGMIVYVLAGRWRRGAETRRRNRMGRLRLG
jgi:rod shape-determining protein MreD